MRNGLLVLAAGWAAACGCGEERPPAQPGEAAAPAAVERVRAEEVVIEAPAGVARPPFAFSAEDEALLEEVQRGAFEYLWTGVAPESGMVLDRSSSGVVSVAGVGFQLAALPVGVKRGWVSEEEARARALSILRALEAHPENRKAGLFYHYLNGDGSPSREGYEFVVSTVDSALLLSGAIVASSSFGGEVAQIADRLVEGADWAFFAGGEEVDPWARGFITLGWMPEDVDAPSGAGAPLPFHWVDGGDEHRLVTFLAVAAAGEKGVAPEVYYRLRRGLGRFEDREMVWFPWSGALFTAFFSHCFIDYAGMGPDDPGAFGVARRSRTDWWENSRRHVLMHRAKAVANPRGLPTLGENAWGLTASDCEAGYCVPGLFPAWVGIEGAVPDADEPAIDPRKVKDNWGDGTVAPYGAGCSVMFEPGAAVAALRHYRGLKGPDGAPLVWRPVEEGGCGFLDAFRLGRDGAESWVARDYVAIDQGPLVLAIENARSGLVWELFHAHPFVARGMERLRLERTRAADRAGG